MTTFPVRSLTHYIFFCRMAEAHENSQMLHSYTVAFSHTIAGPIRKASELIANGGTADAGVAVIASLYRAEMSLPPQLST